MTFSIIPNAFNAGCILLVLNADGIEVERIPCHNNATAEFIARQMKRS